MLVIHYQEVTVLTAAAESNLKAVAVYETLKFKVVNENGVVAWTWRCVRNRRLLLDQYLLTRGIAFFWRDLTANWMTHYVSKIKICVNGQYNTTICITVEGTRFL
jgi:hypothetical protein